MSDEPVAGVGRGAVVPEEPSPHAANFEANALDIVADELAKLKPEALDARRDKLVSIIRNAAAWTRKEVRDVR